MSTPLADLTTLPAPQVVEPLDFEVINAAHRAELLARYPDAAEVLTLESEPLTKLIEAHAYRELLYRQRVNEAARAYLLAFAAGADLDHKAAFYGLVRLAGEGDEHLRTRIQLRVRALAGNGTAEHYELLALSTSPDVRAARARQPAPGQVQLMLWLHERPGMLPEAVRSAVQAVVDDGRHRPVGVPVTVSLARPRPIDITARLQREPGAPANLVAQLQAALPALIDAQAAIGRSLPRSWITARLHVAGIASVRYVGDATPPEITDLAFDEVAAAGTVQLIDAGVAP